MGRTEIKFINLLTLEMTHERLEKIRNIAKQYTLAMDRLTRSRYYPYLEEKYKQQFAADEKSLLNLVSENELFLHENYMTSLKQTG